ncbi:hypothetical protein I2I11_10690 [Pontibacter sp. 172403-2]|uniref:hypothetical protein n=1 Tax=Pontibacter rufus TaxID=2791028 RepID=UPI0018AFF10A|nr:hypothetical protein [Pontibacter sp. 172403-2]MBF9253761.1 hypothetical protein [Pontibacter sp. 172403-2]
MRTIVLALVLAGFTIFRVQAQDDKLTTLMSEREQLVMEYQFYNQQNSNFWGKKSKNDLIAIIETLKKIINKDSELIGAIKVASIKKIAESTVENQREGKMTLEDQRIVNARIADLQSQIKILQSNIKKRERSIKDLQDQLDAADNVRYGKDRVIAVLAVVSFLLLLYAVFLQIRLSKAPKAKKKRA